MNQESRQNSLVSIVSSGPGDPELLTVKAAQRIREADVILHDDLSAGAMLATARDDADIVAVGKRAGKRSFKQEHVNRLLIDYARSHASVVRLKSGDAGIFGRLEEEIRALHEAGIAYEIIPGVPAACAAAAAAHMPLTRRLAARRLQFITGTDVTGSLPEDLNMAALTDTDATTAVYMGRRSFPQLAQLLIDNGLAPDTPAVLAESVARADESLTRSTVAELAQSITEETGTRPALILYGALMESL
ncbi:MAG: uroporphyrinogen-III C-methyltransferase [Gammaproteobacteria bacterium]|nr:MAG: uroporphyrinogen-III C-methyltransferase [Gammaproteobacteria bacterium]